MKRYPPHHVSISPECKSPIVWHSGTQSMLGQHRQLIWRNLLRSYPGQESNPASLICKTRMLPTTPQGHFATKEGDQSTRSHSNVVLVKVWSFKYLTGLWKRERERDRERERKRERRMRNQSISHLFQPDTPVTHMRMRSRVLNALLNLFSLHHKSDGHYFCKIKRGILMKCKERCPKVISTFYHQIRQVSSIHSKYCMCFIPRKIKVTRRKRKVVPKWHAGELISTF